jgi:PAS domain S-box-containing protein
VIDNRVFSEVNEYFCTMTGYNKEELIGKKESMIFLSYGNYESAEREKYYQIAKKGTSSIEARWKKKDGTFIDVLICSAPLVPGNVALGITFTAIDITDRKRAADELRTAYEKNKGLMDFANDAIFITDIESGALIDANKKAQEMIGRTKPEIQKMQYIDLYPVENSEEYREQFHKYTNAGIGVGEGVVVDRDGHQIPVIISSTVLELEGRRCQMGIFHNISEIKIAQTALQLANKKLNLLAEITRHDIRNKLTVFSGYLDLFQEHPPEPQYSMYLTKLHEAVKTIGMNIEFTRLYQNLGVLAPEWQGVNEVFFSACRHVYLKKIRIQSDPDGFEIFADPLLERVFYNLVENAVQYGDRATIIRLTSDESADKLVIKIEDNGIGIPPHDKEKIFSKGFGKNTGLGLFLCREILSITGISIAETGQYQQGACFEIHVPHGTYRYRPGSIRDRCYISVDD